MTWFKLTASQLDDFERKTFYEHIKFKAKEDKKSDDTLYSVKKKKKVNFSEINESDYDPKEFPILGRKKGRVNTDTGHVTRFNNFYLANDGFYYTRQEEDHTEPDLVDENGDIIEKGQIIPFSRFYNGTTHEGKVTSNPDFPSEE